METSVEQLIKERSFESLSAVERDAVQELCATEDEFLMMQQFFRELDHVKRSDKTIINPAVKDSLDGIFTAKFPGIKAGWTAGSETEKREQAPVIPLYQRTWLRVAAVGLLLISTWTIWQTVGSGTVHTPFQHGTQTAKVEKPVPGNQNVLTQATHSTPDNTTKSVSVQAKTPQKVYEGRVDESILAEEITAESDAVVYSGVAFYNEESRGDSSEKATISPKMEPKEQEPAAMSAVQSGRMYDLNPDGAAAWSGELAVSALSLAAEPADLLDLLEPAF